MDSLASLGLSVDSGPVARARDELGRFVSASEAAERAALRFGVTTEGSGRRAAAANDNSARSAERAARAYEGYHKAAVLAARAVGAIAGAAIGTALIRYADQWSDMQSRVGAAIRDMEAAPALMKRIVDIANASYSPLEQTVEVYSRNVSVLRDLGRGATEAADFTEALNHALVLTATRGERAASVQNALSKAMAVGKLQADGLETVLANGGEVAQALAGELGTTVNGLRAMASAGKITGDVIANALITRLDDLRDRAGEMPATIGDAFVRIQTNLIAFIGQMDKASGASEMVATALLSLADNIGRIITYGATAVTMFGTYYVAAFVAANVATMTLAGSLTLLRGALIRTGIGALVVAAGELVYQFARLVEVTGSWGEAWQRLGTFFDSVMYAMRTAFAGLVMSLKGMWSSFIAYFMQTTSAALGAFGAVFDLSEQIKLAENDSRQFQSGAAVRFEDAAKALSEAYKKLRESSPGGAPEIPGGGSAMTGEMDSAAAKRAAEAAESYKRIVEGAREFIAAQELEMQALGMTEEAANALRYEFDLMNQAKQAGIKLTADQTAELKRLAEQMAVSEAATNRAREAMDFAKDVTRGFIDDFRSGIEQGKSVWESFANAALNALDKIVDKLLNEVLDAIFQVNSAGMGGGGGILGSLFGSLFGGGGFSAAAYAGIGQGLYAKGGVFDRSGVTAFAKGGVVNTPTVFPFARGIGLMGEAGPEAIMPLRRGPDGKLGVAANDRAANQNGPQQVNINVNVEGANGDQHVIALVQEGVAKGISELNKALPDRMNQINQNPRRRSA